MWHTEGCGIKRCHNIISKSNLVTLTLIFNMVIATNCSETLIDFNLARVREIRND